MGWDDRWLFKPPAWMVSPCRKLAAEKFEEILAFAGSLKQSVSTLNEESAALKNQIIGRVEAENEQKQEKTE